MRFFCFLRHLAHPEPQFCQLPVTPTWWVTPIAVAHRSDVLQALLPRWSSQGPHISHLLIGGNNFLLLPSICPSQTSDFQGKQVHLLSPSRPCGRQSRQSNQKAPAICKQGVLFLRDRHIVDKKPLDGPIPNEICPFSHPMGARARWQL